MLQLSLSLSVVLVAGGYALIKDPDSGLHVGRELPWHGFEAALHPSVWILWIKGLFTSSQLLLRLHQDCSAWQLSLRHPQGPTSTAAASKAMIVAVLRVKRYGTACVVEQQSSNSTTAADQLKVPCTRLQRQQTWHPSGVEP
jgi:hypothetical protein